MFDKRLIISFRKEYYTGVLSLDYPTATLLITERSLFLLVKV
jgi:hypothetical protein